jgi:hypothetical protein
LRTPLLDNVSAAETRRRARRGSRRARTGRTQGISHKMSRGYLLEHPVDDDDDDDDDDFDEDDDGEDDEDGDEEEPETWQVSCLRPFR